MMDAAYNSNYHIVQSRDYVMILVEMIHDARLIPLDGRPAPPPNVRQSMGVSSGRWEGDTLVVETIGFNDKTWLGAQGQPHSDEMRTIERYRRTDRNTIEFNLTIDDPKTYTKTWVTEQRVAKLRPGVEISESLCVASEEEEFTRRIREPAARQTGKE